MEHMDNVFCTHITQSLQEQMDIHQGRLSAVSKRSDSRFNTREYIGNPIPLVL